MKSIKENNEKTLIVNKSKFICNIIKTNDEENAINEINKIKMKYKDATHNCYAYIIDNKMRFNDDGEPNGTAGMPILNVLKNKDLNDILCVVTRYFGGIKLGAGGLVRAYTNAVVNCIDDENIIDYCEGFEIKIIFDFTNVKIIDNILKNVDIKEKFYTNQITYIVNIPKENLNELQEKLNNLCTIMEIQKNIWVEKKLS